MTFDVLVLLTSCASIIGSVYLAMETRVSDYLRIIFAFRILGLILFFLFENLKNRILRYNEPLLQVILGF